MLTGRSCIGREYRFHFLLLTRVMRALIFPCLTFLVCFVFLFILITVLCINVVFVCCCLVFHTYGKHSVCFFFLFIIIGCLLLFAFASVRSFYHFTLCTGKKIYVLYSFVVCVYTSINRASLCQSMRTVCGPSLDVCGFSFSFFD